MAEKKKGIDDLKGFFSDLNEDDAITGAYSETDQVVDEVMALLEGYGNFSGGIITFKTIFEFLKSHGQPLMEAAKVEAAMKQMKKDRIIDAILTIENVVLYIFQPIPVTEELKSVLGAFILIPKMTLDELAAKLAWSKDQIDNQLKIFQEYKLIKEQDGKWFIPGLANA